jgi:hypothetical protein
VTGQDIGVRNARRHAAARATLASAAAARAMGALALTAALAVLTGCSGGAAPGSTTGPTTSVEVAAGPVHAARSTSPSRSGPPGGTPVMRSAPASPSALPVALPDAGSLPQTSVMPRTDDTAFGNAVHDIWLAVTTGDPGYALPAFFPEKAYEQVKAIGNPEADWQGRLWYDFTLDLAAAHKLVPSDATLVKVIVPAQYARWIGAGACYNNVGYWNVPGARVVYRSGGATRSFGIASFISWRGDWYLVHLGAEVRSSSYGIVDDPEEGEGVPGPPGGC